LGSSNEMASIEELREQLDQAAGLENTLDRRLWVLSIITEALAQHGLVPVLVGGGAVEFYTGGGYATKDVDVVIPSSPAFGAVMSKLGFTRAGRHWFRDDLDYAIEAPGEDIAGDRRKILEVQVGERHICVLGLEDVILDRLNAAAHWKSGEDRRWADRLIEMHRDIIDLDYLKDRACVDRTADLLNEILQALE
jgi:hypothetical protein